MVKTVSAKDFEKEVIYNQRPVLVDFYAEWCGPCKMLSPTINEVSEELGGQLDFAKVNIDTAPSVAEFFGVMSVPTLILFKGGTEMVRTVGVVQKDTLIGTIMEYINE